MHLTRVETQIPKGCHFFGPLCMYIPEMGWQKLLNECIITVSHIIIFTLMK